MPHKRSPQSLLRRLPRPSWQPHPWCPASPPRDALCHLSFPCRSTFGDARISVGSPPLTSSLFQVVTCPSLPEVMGNPSVIQGPQLLFPPRGTLSFLCSSSRIHFLESPLPLTLSLLLPKTRLKILSTDLPFLFMLPSFSPLPTLQPPQNLSPSLLRCSVGTPMPKLQVTPLISPRGGWKDEPTSGWGDNVKNTLGRTCHLLRNVMASSEGMLRKLMDLYRH